jgi:predicted RNA binding protein YcfA (HicA-like mRNA interferase family)
MFERFRAEAVRSSRAKSLAGDVRPPPYRRDMPKKYREVRQLLADAGWVVVRQRGSHEIWAHPDQPERVVVAGKNSQTVPVGTLGSIRRATGLEKLR